MKRFLNCLFKIIFSRTLVILLMVVAQILALLGSFIGVKSAYPYIWQCMYLLGAFLIIYIINRDEPTDFKMTWIILVCLFPVLGALIYVFVMGNFGGIGLKAKLGRRMEETKGLLGTNKETQEALKDCPASFRGFAHYMEHTAGFPTYHNSSVVYYPLGEDKFADLKEELKKAERFIFLEYFIIERGTMWDAVLEILKEKVKEGVEVRVMYDGMCSIMLLPYQYPSELQSYGIRAKMFAPIVPFLSTTQNNRDHRKIVVIDGKVAFTGGVNLADEYINEVKRFGHWKDVAVKITGDAVRSFTVMFLQMWNVDGKTAEDYAKYLQKKETGIQSDGFVMPYGDSPFDEELVGETVYMDILNRAKEYVHIMSPYLIIDQTMMTALTFAAKRGVDVKLILPHIPDKKFAFALAKSHYRELITAGVRIFEYTPGFVHAKVFTSDGEKAAVGTINLDYRSLYLHFECAAFLYRVPEIARIEEDFQATLEKCQEIRLGDLKKESLLLRAEGWLLKVLAPLM